MIVIAVVPTSLFHHLYLSISRWGRIRYQSQFSLPHAWQLNSGYRVQYKINVEEIRNEFGRALELDLNLDLDFHA